ncbi:MAG: hypothetical protein ACXU8A_00615 [Burkholderiaceae bacterium]
MNRQDDFRQRFSQMADEAIINRNELAVLLATTSGAISQMAYLGELPPRAFPSKRRAVWFARDIRKWLSKLSAKSDKETLNIDSGCGIIRKGRPRLPADRL